MKKLSIVIPVFNEEKTLELIVDKVQRVHLSKIKKEIIIVNDASWDKSAKVIEKLKKKYSNINSFSHSVNKGKGAAIRTGFKEVTGDWIVIQDGDMEYNPEEFVKLLAPLLARNADVVYGSRVLGEIRGFSIPSHYYGNLFLSFMTRFLYGTRITDMETCYKMMTREVVRNLHLQANRFDIEPEITAQIVRKGYKIVEVPIVYNSRSFKEGKKITWKDGVAAVVTLLKYRLMPLR